MKILTKDFVKNFSYTTINTDRSGVKDVRIDGRQYCKFGIYQAVTLVGDLWDVYDGDVKRNRRMLFVGVAKQHPRDLGVNKELSYEVAHLNALENPTIVMEVGPNFCGHDFRHLASMYVDTLNLQFVKTRDEIDMENLMSMIEDFEMEGEPYYIEEDIKTSEEK